MHAIVRTDKLLATVNPAGLVSVRYQPDGVMTDIDNGNLLMIDVLEGGTDREIFVGLTPTSTASLCDIVLVSSPEVIYDGSKRNLSDFYNRAGAIARGYHIHDNDIFSVTREALEGDEPAVGCYVELADSTKFNVVVSPTGATLIGKIININTVDKVTYYVVRVSSRSAGNSGGGAGTVYAIPDATIMSMFS